MKGRLLMIFIFILLFIGTVMIFGSALNNNVAKTISQSTPKQEISLDQEKGVFERSAMSDSYAHLPTGNRTMQNYYENRAYLGAPPMITHPLLSETGIGGKACLQCHQKGGYVNQFKAYAPVTPHPDWINCRQCHLPMSDGSLFKDTNWEKPAPPKLGIQALTTSPSVMPHGISNREKCLTCHVGPAVPKEIRVTHPERINCRQCHVPSKSHELFTTPLETRASSFIRGNYMETNESKIDHKDQTEIKSWIGEKESN